jgi:hypothetical protein
MEENVDTRPRAQATENFHNIQTTGTNTTGVARPAADSSPDVAQTTRSYKAPGASTRLPFRPLPASFSNHQNTTEGNFLGKFAGLSIDESDNGATDMPPQHHNASSRSVLETVKVAPHSGYADVDVTMVDHETNHTASDNHDSFNPPLGATTFSPEAFMKNGESLNELLGYQQRLWVQYEREGGSAKERERAESSIRSFIKQQNPIEPAQQSQRQFAFTLDSFTFSPEKTLSKESLAEVRRFQNRLWTSKQNGHEKTVLKQNQRVTAESSIKKFIKNEKIKALRAHTRLAFAAPQSIFSPERFLDKKSLAEVQGLQDRVWTWRERRKNEYERIKEGQRVAAEDSIRGFIKNQEQAEVAREDQDKGPSNPLVKKKPDNEK